MSIQESLKISPFKGHSDIALIEFDLIGEKVNKLSSPVMKRLEDVVDELGRSNYKAAVLISRKPKIFIAGADIEEIKGIRKQDEALSVLKVAHGILNKLEDLKIPIVAAINGACLGGGCELILCCDYRLATDDSSTRIGLPEVKLGIIPGFGGCVRLPKLIGIQEALKIILPGKDVDGRKAEKLGLVDKCVPANMLETFALQMAQDAIKKGKRKKTCFKAKGTMNQFLESAIGRSVVFSGAQKQTQKETKGHYPAPLKALEVIRKTAGWTNREKALDIEMKAFSEVVITDISKNLIHIFYMTEAIKKQTGVENAAVKPREVRGVGVLGAGTMGGGIAQLAADRGIEARVKDISNEALAKAFQTAKSIWDKALQRKRIDRYKYAQKMALVSGGLTYDGFKRLDVIVEAIVEDMNIKKKVLADLAQNLRDDAIVATNTSSLSVTEMATAYPKPENFGGMHFFNPVHLMPLVEVIRGEKTSDETTATIFDLSKKMGKFPVVVKDGPGFLVNRLLLPYLNEAVYLVGEGYSVEDIDKAFLKFGMPMGPLHLIDEIGIDVAVKVAKIFHKAFGERAEPSPLMSKIVEGNQRLGKKNGKGFYLFDDRGKPTQVDSAVYKDLGLGSPKSGLDAQEAVKRGIYAMINEAALALIEDRIVNTPAEVDLAMIMGTGFPPFRGGLLKYADSVGSAAIVDDLEIFAAKIGKRFKPCVPLRNLAKNNRSFYGT